MKTLPKGLLQRLPHHAFHARQGCALACRRMPDAQLLRNNSRGEFELWCGFVVRSLTVNFTSTPTCSKLLSVFLTSPSNFLSAMPICCLSCESSSMLSPAFSTLLNAALLLYSYAIHGGSRRPEKTTAAVRDVSATYSSRSLPLRVFAICSSTPAPLWTAFICTLVSSNVSRRNSSPYSQLHSLMPCHPSPSLVSK